MPKKTNNIACETDVDDIEFLICHLANLWRRLIGTKIKSLGISITEKRVLFAIARHPGMTQVQIANLLELEPQNLVRSLDKLEGYHWIQKTLDSNDRRVKCLSITDEAKKVISEIKEVSRKIKPQVLFGMSEEKVGILTKQLIGMRENLLKELGEDV